MMNNSTKDTWQIVYIPDEPPITPNQQRSVIEPKYASTLTRRLNQIAPFEYLRHVKRIRKKHLEGESSIAILVCKYAATSKAEWEEQRKLWPTFYDPPTYNIDAITGFSEEDSLSVSSFMNFLLTWQNLIVNAAVIVDPSVQQIITNGCDEIFSWHAPTNKTCIRDDCFKQSTTLSSHQSNGRLETANSCYWHPLQHAAIVSIESSADRDRRLFPGLGDTAGKSFGTSQSSYVGLATSYSILIGQGEGIQILYQSDLIYALVMTSILFGSHV
ncbi:unnamed protein product [Dovyalis caffra]|uniref:Uncharacterized protein n=1 Tax=Dovyalis caffra TaxID=77055 RepID=A0AAV1STB0_9ROSI|nr:unnamed protein product [Dovyalis caffra]